MRAINSLKDVEIVLKDLQNTVDLWRSQDIDMQKRRVVNAHPSKNLYDYVVRKELQEAIVQQSIIAEARANTDYIIVFSNSSGLYTGLNVSPAYIVKNPSVPLMVSAIALNSSRTVGTIIQPTVNGVHILDGTGYLEIPVDASGASSGVLNFSNISDVTCEIDDLVNIDCTSAGTATKVTIEIWMRIL